MSTIATSSPLKVLARFILIAMCALCLQSLFGCAAKAGDEGTIDHVIKYANSRIFLDTPVKSVFMNTPDASYDVTLVNFEQAADGTKEIEIVPVVTSNTMASWTEDEWAQNRDDLYFNLVAHFGAVCKQAHEYGDVPDEYVVTHPDYMIVCDSQKSTGFIITSSGVFQKTDDPENPIGDPVVLDIAS